MSRRLSYGAAGCTFQPRQDKNANQRERLCKRITLRLIHRNESLRAGARSFFYIINNLICLWAGLHSCVLWFYIYFIMLHMREAYKFIREVRWMRRPTTSERLYFPPAGCCATRELFFSRRAPLISPRYGFYSVCAANTKRFTRPECVCNDIQKYAIGSCVFVRHKNMLAGIHICARRLFVIPGLHFDWWRWWKARCCIIHSQLIMDQMRLSQVSEQEQ